MYEYTRKILISKDEYVLHNWSEIGYHCFEGFACSLEDIVEAPNHIKLIFKTYKSQREVLDALHWCGVDTNWRLE